MKKNKKTYEQLQMLTNDELCMDIETGEVTIVNNGTKNTDKDLKNGTKMISDMISNTDFNCQIERQYIEDNGCYVNYTDDGAIITMNDWAEEDGNWAYEVSDGNGGRQYEYHKDVSYIILGHELIYATHYMNGNLADSSRVVYNRTDVGIIKNVRGDLNVSEEYNTVGLPHIVEYPNPNGGLAIRRFYLPYPGVLSENELRLENGLNKRIAY